MAAPSSTVWGSTIGSYGRIGINTSLSNTNTTTKVTVDIWFWSKYSVSDTSNTLYFDNLASSGSATTSRGSKSITTTVESGDGWSTSNQVKIATYTYNYDRGTSAVKRYLYAKLANIDRVGGTMSVSTTVTIPKLPTYTISYNANGGSGAPSNQTKYYGIDLTLSKTKPTRTGYSCIGWALTEADADDGNYYYGIGGNCGKNEDLTLYAVWKINQYTNKISHWASGFKNGEGNNSAKDCFKLDDTTFTSNYGSKFTLSASRGTTIPNGFSLGIARTNSVTGEWQSYSIGSTITQQAKVMGFEYFYTPNTYTITYNLDGGTNSSSNPSTYNVLYGVTFQEPTRKGYRFDGWYIEDRLVDGINVGENASFTNASNLYNQLATRTTGNITVTARWKSEGSLHIKKDGTWVKGLAWIKVDGTWKKGIPWIKVGGTWKKGGA